MTKFIQITGDEDELTELQKIDNNVNPKLITFKIFENLEELNDYVTKFNIQVLSIETAEQEYNTSLPDPKGGDFYSKRDVVKLWYRI